MGRGHVLRAPWDRSGGQLTGRCRGHSARAAVDCIPDCCNP